MISAFQVLWIFKTGEGKRNKNKFRIQCQYLLLSSAWGFRSVLYTSTILVRSLTCTERHYHLSVCTVPGIHMYICVCIVTTIFCFSCDRTSMRLNTKLSVACRHNANEHDSKFTFMIIQGRDVVTQFYISPIHALHSSPYIEIHWYFLCIARGMSFPSMSGPAY